MRRLLILAILMTTSAFADDNEYKFRATWVGDHFALTDTSGTHFKWLNLGCPKDVVCELRINSHGGARSNEADLNLLHADDATLRATCLRKSGCAVNQKSLAFGESVDIPSGSTIEFSASPETEAPCAPPPPPPGSNAYTFRVKFEGGQFEFSEPSGAHWKSMTAGCGESAECEAHINSWGVGVPDPDLGFSQVRDQMLRVRCLRQSGCLVLGKSLKQGDTIEVPSGSIVDFSAVRETPPSSSRNH